MHDAVVIPEFVEEGGREGVRLKLDVQGQGGGKFGRRWTGGGLEN